MGIKELAEFVSLTDDDAELYKTADKIRRRHAHHSTYYVIYTRSVKPKDALARVRPRQSFFVLHICTSKYVSYKNHTTRRQKNPSKSAPSIFADWRGVWCHLAWCGKVRRLIWR